MRRIAVIEIGVPPDAQAEWEALLKPYVLRAKWFAPLRLRPGSKASGYCDVDMDSPQYEALLRLLSERGLRFPEDRDAPDYEERFDAVLNSPGVTWRLLRIEHRYTDSELRSFPFLVLGVARREIDAHGPNYGTQYDLLTGCPRCGCGARQVSPFYAPVRVFPRTGLICHSTTEIFVAPPVADALRRAKVTGLELRQVRSSREHKPLPWWQIIPCYTMPRMSPKTRSIVVYKPCPRCHRDGHYDSAKQPREIVYSSKKVDPDEIPDVAATWECIGVSKIDREDFRNSRIANPFILVKPRIFDIFRKLKVKHAFFHPVRVE